MEKYFITWDLEKTLVGWVDFISASELDISQNIRGKLIEIIDYSFESKVTEFISYDSICEFFKELRNEDEFVIWLDDWIYIDNADFCFSSTRTYSSLYSILNNPKDYKILQRNWLKLDYQKEDLVLEAWLSEKKDFILCDDWLFSWDTLNDVINMLKSSNINIKEIRVILNFTWKGDLYWIPITSMYETSNCIDWLDERDLFYWTKNGWATFFNWNTLNWLPYISNNKIASKKASIPEKKSNFFCESIFDLNKPQLDIIVSLNTFKITCFDPESISCKSITYGLSKTNIDCVNNLNYNSNESIKFENEYYACAKGIDDAGNFEEIIRPLITGFEKLKNNSSSLDFNNTDNNSSNNNNNNKSNINQNNPDEFFTQGNFPTGNNKSGPNYLLYTAIILLIGGVGSSAFYAYKKGYLNNQLKKLGIKVPNNSQNKSKVFSNKVKTNNGFRNKSKGGQIVKSKYDRHLTKLNDFIDEKINGSNDMFNNFDNDNQKGKVKGYKDTLLNKKKKVSKNDFDEFYSSSKNALKNQPENLEKDAEAFEKFHKNKKNQSSKKK